MSAALSGEPTEIGLMGDPNAHFKRGLQARAVEIERYALAEVERLEKTVAKLAEENARLRSQLPDSTVDQYNPKEAELPAGAIHSSASPGALAVASASSRPADSRVMFLRQGSFDSGVQYGSERSRQKTIDTEGIKRKLTEQRKPREFNVKDYYKHEGVAQWIARSLWFEHVTHFVVLLNAVWIAVDLDLNGKPLLQSPFIFQFVEFCFVVVFSSEMVVRFLAYKQTKLMIHDRWFLFDLVLVSTMVFESVVLSLILLITKTTETVSLGILSALRILRLLRLARVARLYHIVPELRTMVSGMMAGIRTVGISGLLLFSLTYIFAIVLRQVSLQTESGSRYFKSVPSSVYTLLIESMLPDNGAMLFAIGEDRWYMGVIYFVFLILSAITIMNLLIGVLCDVVGRVSNEETERRALEAMSEKLQALLKSIDNDYDGEVSKAEFEHIINNDEAIKILVDVGIDVHSLVEDADFIFRHSHGAESKMSFEEFKEVVLEFRATNAATIRTIASLRKVVRESFMDVDSRLVTIERDMAYIQPSLVLPTTEEI